MTQRASPTPPAEDQQTPGCCHHWVIQPATGPVSQGKCQNCNEVREFKNYVEASTWGDDKGKSRSTPEVAKAAVTKTEAENEE